MVMAIAGQKTVREIERDHEECEGCSARHKPVYSYLGQVGEPIVCSKRCFEKALVIRFGGVREPTTSQLKIVRGRRAARFMGGNVVPIVKRKAG